MLLFPLLTKGGSMNREQTMVKTISFFNNKGGVGKTTCLYHVAHRIADLGKTVLIVDCDSQCNLTAYALQDDTIEIAFIE
jgi:cellulose biosynthesis protein BcsQ